MTKIINSGSDDILPEFLDIPLGEINQYWGHWVEWMACGRRVDFFNAMSGSKRMWDVIHYLDGLYSKLESQKRKQDALNAGPA